MRLLLVAVVAAVLVALAAVLGTFGDGSEEAQASPWELAQPMSQRRSYIAAAEIGGKIYAAGGMVGETGRPLDLVARYDPATDTWETLHRLPDPLRAAAGAAVDGTFYVIGGTTEDGNTAAVNAYDPESNTWTPRAPLPEPRFNHAALELGGKIYVLGATSRARSAGTSSSTTPPPTRGRRAPSSRSPTTPSTRSRSTGRSG